MLMIRHLDCHLRRLARGVARLKGTARSYDLQMLLRQATLGRPGCLERGTRDCLSLTQLKWKVNTSKVCGKRECFCLLKTLKVCHSKNMTGSHETNLFGEMVSLLDSFIAFKKIRSTIDERKPADGVLKCTEV